MEGKPYVGAYIEKRLLERLDNYRGEQRPIPSVSDVLRNALIFFLNHHKKEGAE